MAFRYLSQVPTDPAAAWSGRNRVEKPYGSLANRFRPKLIELLGEEKARKSSMPRL